MSTTSYLPPVSAVRMVWARTGAFSNDVHSQNAANLVEQALKDIKQQAEKAGTGREKEYITSAMATMDASLRSLDTVYKGRALNFQENEKLRSAYLDSIKESLEFGKKSQDFLRSLPTMTVGAAGGVTVAQALNGSELSLWGIGLGLAAAGYLVNLWFVRHTRRQKQMLYIAQDYDRGLYYDQYVNRVSTILTSLYMDIDRIHKNVFGDSYPIDGTGVKQIIEDMINGVRPSFCQYVHKHIQENKITPELWALCESGIQDGTEQCSYFKAEEGG